MRKKNNLKYGGGHDLNPFNTLTPMNIVVLFSMLVALVSGYVRLEANVVRNTELLEEIKLATQNQREWAEDKHLRIWDYLSEHTHK